LNPTSRALALLTLAASGAFALTRTHNANPAGFAVLFKPRSNQSINRTNNGGQRLRVYVRTVPPLFAAYLQR
jgi:hypothetical protein